MKNGEAPSRASALALSFVTFLWISPFLWLVTTAFDNRADGSLRFPEELGIANFFNAASGPALQQFINSIYISAAAATLTVIVTAGAAYPLSRINIPGRNAFLWGLVVLRMLPAPGLIVPLYFTAQSTGLLNSTGVILAVTILHLPFSLLLLKNFFDTVPVELEEAAHVEGATLFQIIARIVFPMSRAGIAVIWFYSFTSTWNEFLLPLIFSRTNEEFPMAIGLYSAFGLEGTIDYGYLAAYSIIYAAPAIVTYFLLRRNMNTGFAGVGVKG